MKFLILSLWSLLISSAVADPRYATIITRAQRLLIIKSPKVTILLRQGTVIGLSDAYAPQDVHSFRGIPYAEPVVRFKPSVRVAESFGHINATSYGPICPQVLSNPNQTYSENCLSINVFKPSNATSHSALPVVAYIHGGAFNVGYSYSRDIGNMIATRSEPYIGVSFNYRIGVFGFLSNNLGARIGAQNLGLRDQILALQWVQENIAAFGGDPSQVTIMGNSAGAHSIGHHIQSPLSTGLFHRAIMESGSPTARFCQSAGSALSEIQFSDLTSALSINTQNESDNAIIDALTAVPLADFTTAESDIYLLYNPSIQWPWQPTIDGPGGVIPQAPLDLWGSGDWNKVPILTGSCDNEDASFVPNLNTSAQFNSFFQVLNPELTSYDMDALNSLYPDPLTTNSTMYKQLQTSRGPQFTRVTAAYGEFAYIQPVRHSAYFASSRALFPPLYLYEGAMNISVPLGTGHDCINPYVHYKSDITDISQTQRQLSAAVNEYWTSFIVSGNPNSVRGKSSNRATWPRYTPDGAKANTLVLGKGNDERAGGDSLGVLTDAVVEDRFVKTGHFWWSRTILTEH
ncbi:related to extracellular lipase [Rhynchosporium secalis]|uniref:Carboxylic ester hydrolase n=1 Tax=Rhynchosporium secalis TaxID=38038 RepID=A0A1E1M3W5_RHYSE|nr:related to extracellular lipase [Rhynchosporium secalis]